MLNGDGINLLSNGIYLIRSGTRRKRIFFLGSHVGTNECYLCCLSILSVCSFTLLSEHSKCLQFHFVVGIYYPNMLVEFTVYCQ